MAAKVPTKAALDCASHLAQKIKALPSSCDDRPGYDDGIKLLKHQIVSCGGTFSESWNGAGVRLHGFAASSTSGIADACRNWITQVTLKAASASMAGAA